MADKIKEMEIRLNRLEDRLKASFLEVEKRFENMKIDEPAIMVVEQRMQELEDLLLLLQLEIAKIRESTGEGMEFGPAPTAQSDVDARLRKIEETPSTGDVSDRLTKLEQRLLALERQPQPQPGGNEKSYVADQLDEIEKRLNKIERESEMIGKGLHDDVRKILSS
jgi:chromosome segregation ATPase